MWSPDGQQILFVSKVYPNCGDDACNQKRISGEAESMVKARIFTQLLYRHWNHFIGDRRNHLFLVSAAGGVPRDLTPGDEHEVPPFQLEGPDQYGFSPDGKEIAFEENLDPVPAISTNSDIFTLRLDDPNAKPVKISTALGGDHSPAYSPDGKYIAWRSQARAGYESDRFRLVVYDRATKEIREPLPKFDRWVDEFTWSPDSQWIYFAAGDVGESPVFCVSLTNNEYRGARPQRRVRRPSRPTADGKVLIASRMTAEMPSEAVSLDVSMVPHTLISGAYSKLPPGRPDLLPPQEVLKETRSHISMAPCSLSLIFQRWIPSGSLRSAKSGCKASSSSRQLSMLRRNIR